MLFWPSMYLMSKLHAISLLAQQWSRSGPVLVPRARSAEQGSQSSMIRLELELSAELEVVPPSHARTQASASRSDAEYLRLAGFRVLEATGRHWP